MCKINILHKTQCQKSQYLHHYQYKPFSAELKSEVQVQDRLTWSPGVLSTVCHVEGLSARNTQGRQDEEDE